MKSRMMREKVREAMLSSAWRKQFMQALVVILLLSAVAAAQEKPEDGNQTGDLQKATQNPVSSLISVPLQNNTNFGVNPGYRNQDVLNIQPVIPIGISKDWNLLVRWITPIIYQPLPNAPGTPETGEDGLGDTQEAGKVDLGSWTDLPIAHSNKYVSGTGEAGRRAIHRCPDATGPLDAGGAGKQCLVGGGFGQPSRCESVPDAVLHQLQPAKRLVHWNGADHHRQLGSQPRQRVDGAGWRRHRTGHEVRGAAGEPPRSVLRQCCASCECSVLDHAAADFFPVSQAVEGAEKDDAGERAEAIGARATVGVDGF